MSKNEVRMYIIGSAPDTPNNMLLNATVMAIDDAIPIPTPIRTRAQLFVQFALHL
jgi:hypothetical protein